MSDLAVLAHEKSDGVREVPRGLCRSDILCSWAACVGLSDTISLNIAVADKPEWRPETFDVAVPTGNGWEVLATPTQSPWKRSEYVMEAFELFAKSGDAQGARIASRMMQNPELAISLLLGQLPRDEENYTTAEIIACGADSAKTYTHLGALIDSYYIRDAQEAAMQAEVA